jgi:hypothetical protein
VFENCGVEWQAPPMSERLLKILYIVLFFGPLLILGLFFRVAK